MAEGGGRRGAQLLAYICGGLIALGAIALLVLVIAGQDDAQQSAPAGGTAAEGPAVGETGAEAGQDDEEEAEPGAGLAPARGFLTLGATQGDLLEIAQRPGELEESVGQPVNGSGVPVQQMTSRGAWLGDSPSARVWVRLTDSQVRNLRNGDRVAIEGSVNAVYLGGGQIGLAPEEGLAQVLRQGGYVRPTSVAVQR